MYEYARYDVRTVMSKSAEFRSVEGGMLSGGEDPELCNALIAGCCAANVCVGLDTDIWARNKSIKHRYLAILRLRYE
jgi:hypothetical protein